MSVPPQLARADAIVVLAHSVDLGGHLTNQSMRRALGGIRLYKQGLAPLLVFSGVARGGRPLEAEARVNLAQELGVPGPAVMAAPTAHTTREEAVRARALLWPIGARRILLVTDWEHMQRARGLFEHVGFEVFPAPVSAPSRVSTPEDRLHLARAMAQELAAQVYNRVVDLVSAASP
jgi:uncharacterized SAM-binding protein YcdF (DUF218 family)